MTVLVRTLNLLLLAGKSPFVPHPARDLPNLSTAAARAIRLTPPALLRNMAPARIFTGKLLAEL